MTRRAKGALAAIIALLAAGTFFIGRSSAPATPTDSSVQQQFVTAQIDRRYLESRLAVNGTVVTSTSTRLIVVPPAGVARAITSAVPKTEGSIVKAGDVLTEVSGRPIIALPGAIPAYRDLKAGDSGPDVRQLQQALRQLGLHPDDNASVGALTLAAVRALYGRLGYRAPDGDRILSAELMFVAKLPGRLASAVTEVGSPVTDAPLVVDSGAPSVQVDVALGTSVPAKGSVVDLMCAAEPVAGVVASVSTQGDTSAPTATGDGTNPPDSDTPALVVTVAPAKPISADLLDSACVGTIVSRITDTQVVAIPSSAVFSRSDGGSSIQIANGGSTPLTVPVTLGRSADGWIELVNPPAAAAVGAEVVVGTMS